MPYEFPQISVSTERTGKVLTEHAEWVQLQAQDWLELEGTNAIKSVLAVWVSGVSKMNISGVDCSVGLMRSLS